MGSLEVILCVALAISVLARPPVLRVVYPWVVGPNGASDAVRIAQWLQSEHRERSLQLALTGGHMTSKELNHYSDVRRVLHWPPRMAVAIAALLVLLVAIRGFEGGLTATLTRAQHAGLLVWLALVLVAASLAWWDWKEFFAWVHRPLFGERSWRFGRDAYSLQLFPAAFWRAMTIFVLLAPGLVLAIISGFVIVCGKGTHPPAPEEKRPTIL